MSVGGGIVSFVLVWWLVLFTTLPIRPKKVSDEPGKHAKGVDRGAPVDPALWFKIKLTTAIATPIWLVVFSLISFGVFSAD